MGDLPDADVKPAENVLFVCKLNPVTTDEDLEIIFSRFGNITRLVGFLNIFYSGIEYTEKDWVRLKVRHYPLQSLV